MQHEAIISAQQLEKKCPVWNAWQIYWSTVFGGYFCGFYLMNQNYKAFGYPKLALKTLLVGIFSSLVFLTTVYFLPAEWVESFPFMLSLGQGFFCGSYILYAHYKLIHNWDRLKEFFIACGMIAFVLIMSFYFPQKWFALIPVFFIPIAQGGILHSIIKMTQENDIKNLISEGSKRYSYFRLFGVILLAILFQTLFIFILASFCIIFRHYL